MAVLAKGIEDENGELYRFIPPIASESEAGGIIAKEKTTEEDEVAIDKTNGKLYSKGYRKEINELNKLLDKMNDSIWADSEDYTSTLSWSAGNFTADDLEPGTSSISDSWSRARIFTPFGHMTKVTPPSGTRIILSVFSAVPNFDASADNSDIFIWGVHQKKITGESVTFVPKDGEYYYISIDENTSMVKKYPPIVDVSANNIDDLNQKTQAILECSCDIYHPQVINEVAYNLSDSTIYANTMRSVLAQTISSDTKVFCTSSLFQIFAWDKSKDNDTKIDKNSFMGVLTPNGEFQKNPTDKFKTSYINISELSNKFPDFVFGIMFLNPYIKSDDVYIMYNKLYEEDIIFDETITIDTEEDNSSVYRNYFKFRFNKNIKYRIRIEAISTDSTGKKDIFLVRSSNNKSINYICDQLSEYGGFITNTEDSFTKKLNLKYRGMWENDFVTESNADFLYSFTRHNTDLTTINQIKYRIIISGPNTNTTENDYVINSLIYSEPNSMKRPYLTGHRGLKNLAPENTIASFELAGKKKLAQCETDIRATADGVYVCMHDDTIDRTTNGVGTLSSITFAKLQTYYVDITPQGDYNQDQLKVPTIEEYVKVCKLYGMICQIELKENLGLEAIEILEKYDMKHRAILTSTNLEYLVRVRRQHRDIVLHWIKGSTNFSDLDTLDGMQPCSISFDYTDVNAVPVDIEQKCGQYNIQYCFRAADNTNTLNWHIQKGATFIPTNVLYITDDSEDGKNDIDITNNIFSEKLKAITYEPITKYGVVRLYYKCNFVKGRSYRIVANVNQFIPNPYAEDEAIVFKTTLSDDNLTAIDYIAGRYKENINSGDIISANFTASEDANYLYVYLSPKYEASSNQTVDIVTTVYENKLDIINENETGVFSKKINLTTSPDSHDNYLMRNFVPYEFISGKTYNIKIKCSNFVIRPYLTSSSYISIRTTLSEDVSSIIDEIRSFHDQNQESCIKKNAEIDVTFTATEDAKYLYVYTNLGTSDASMIVEISESHDKGSYDYYGERINLKKYKYDIEKIISTAKPSDVTQAFQGHATYNNKLIRLFHTGYAAVYDMPKVYKDSTPIAKFKLGSYNESNQHANSCNFSNTFYNNNTTFPLLYVSGGNSGDSFECDVENITYSNGTYSSTHVQKIILDQSNFNSYGFETYWGWPAWLIDNDNKALYCFGCKYRTNGSMQEYDAKNKFIITKFDIPSLSSSNVTLTGSHVKEQWTSPYDIGFTQGGTIYGDYLFYAFGTGIASRPSIIKVFSLTQKAAIATLKLSDTVLGNVELEDLCVYDDRLFVGTNENDMYLLDFK